MSKGARFYRTDLHLHTPASKDFKDKSATPEDIIKTAEQAGLDVIAVTDHNSAEWVDKVRDASKASSTVVVIPGVEITTPGGHILGLFEREFKQSRIEDLLIEVGIPREKFGTEEAISSDTAFKVMRAITAAGGLAIAAHANNNNGFIKESKGQHAIKIVPERVLAALEFRKEADVTKFCGGTVPKYPPKACTHASDAHRLSEYGRYVTYFKMHEPSLHGIRHAFIDYEVKVRFPWDYSEAQHPRILSLAVDQGFFGSESFDFHEGLNCLIGGKGTGKSTAIELLRFCFDDVSDFQHIKQDHAGKIESLVGRGGTVEVDYLDSDGVVKSVRRQVSSSASPRDVRDPAGNPATIASPPTFYSQGELVLIATDLTAQLEMIDRRIDISQEDADVVDASTKLAENARAILAVDPKIERLENELSNPETGLQATEDQHKELKNKIKQPIFREFPRWETEQTYLDSLEQSLVDVQDDASQRLDAISLTALGISIPTKSPNKKELDSLGDLQTDIQAKINDAKKLITDEIKNARTSISDTRDRIKPAFDAKKSQHADALKKTGEASVRKADSQFRQLEKRLESLRKKETALSDHKASRTKLENARGKLLDKLDEAKQRRYAKRVDKADDFERLLPGLIEVSVDESGDTKTYTSRLRDWATGARVQQIELEKATSSISPRRLVELVHADDEVFSEVVDGP